MMKKSFYEAPEAELLLVKFEENILLSGGSEGKAGQDLGKGNSYDFGDSEE